MKESSMFSFHVFQFSEWVSSDLSVMSLVRLLFFHISAMNAFINPVLEAFPRKLSHLIFHITWKYWSSHNNNSCFFWNQVKISIFRSYFNLRQTFANSQILFILCILVQVEVTKLFSASGSSIIFVLISQAAKFICKLFKKKKTSN